MEVYLHAFLISALNTFLTKKESPATTRYEAGSISVPEGTLGKRKTKICEPRFLGRPVRSKVTKLNVLSRILTRRRFDSELDYGFLSSQCPGGYQTAYRMSSGGLPPSRRKPLKEKTTTHFLPPCQGLQLTEGYTYMALCFDTR
jgi:hypothetical protein